MERGKKIILGILVFLVTTIFYREFKLKTNEIKNIEIIENKEIVKNEIIQEEKTEEIDKNIVLEVETKKETETLVKLDKEISEKTVETILEDNDLENKIAKDWEDQENEELTDIDNNIDLEEKIVLENLEYTIKKGDTISDLSKEYKIKTDYIYANNVDKNLRILQVGKKINIPTESGIFYSVKKGDTFEGLSKRFEVDVKIIKEDNEIDRLLIGTKIFLREPKVSKYLNSFKQQYVKKTDLGTFSNPLVAMSLTSTFGSRKHPVLKKVLNHAGVDLKAKTGTRVSSAREGVVSFAGRASGYGKLIIIKHADGYETRYAHLSRIDVKKGQKISQNQMIALSGATGRVSGPHLHFEIRKNGKIQNPLTYLKF
ncbi:MULTISPECIES: peptidoglycan DD-metalloendopeptidase family protein [Cetobacterium]|uniref:Peptidoglycan DD-metalloendopeptidase family protein n=1 Tax=Candidatus Cetobacterium colombiensis TaxID=3073100 RepID=A0ABU4WE46_9FUSO|nr:peptidoglycan DD-metalloendopeptidase family protein [Candidatus Cetobacterium colombiensis]MDX8336773.1 peptidoglycan DD-metalloendopeptidase family protein [Candidatus Cetobacterium colombiensis]